MAVLGSLATCLTESLVLYEGLGECVGVQFDVWKGVWRRGWGGVQASMFRLGSMVKLSCNV